MGHFFEFVTELLFGLARHSPDEMPNDITYKSDFIVKHPTKKNLARIFASLLIIVVFLLLWLIIKHETRYLFAIFVVLGCVLLVLSLVSFSFRCVVTETFLESSYWGLSKKYIPWRNIQCVRIIEKTDEKSVMIALYNKNGKCVIDINTDMENAWYVVKMTEEKSIIIKREKDLSLKQTSRL